MNYRNSINTAMNAINKFEPSEQIGNILEDFSQERENRDKYDGSIEGRLNDMRDRYERRGSGTGINLYPSEHKGACHNFCLAIATKKFDKPRRKTESGFRGIMLEMAAYWFSCLKVNEETLILTSTWDNDIFEGQYKKIIDSYTKTHNKKVFIIEVGPTGFFPRYPY